jgi:hypothetical protein
MRSSPSAEPAGRRGAVAYPNRWPARSPDAGGDAQCHSRGRCSAEDSPREEQATGLPNHLEMRSSPSAEPAGRRGVVAYPSRWPARSPDAGGDAQCHSRGRCSAEAPQRKEQATGLPNHLEMRSSPSAEPAGRRGAVAYRSRWPARSPDAGGDAQCHSRGHCSAEDVPREEQARRLRYPSAAAIYHSAQYLASSAISPAVSEATCPSAKR